MLRAVSSGERKIEMTQLAEKRHWLPAEVGESVAPLCRRWLRLVPACVCLSIEFSGCATSFRSWAEKQLLVVSYQADVRNKDAADEIVKTVVENWGKLDILVNNAGIVRDTLLAMMSNEQWHEVIETNLTSVFTSPGSDATDDVGSLRADRQYVECGCGIRQQRPDELRRQQRGIEGFTRCLAKELASRGVTVNAVAPGFIETDMTAVVRNAAEAEIKKAIPARRLGKPEDIAQVVLFLAGTERPYVTGQVLKVDGGLTLGGFRPMRPRCGRRG